MVALGHELRRAGHEVVFGASANHGPWIRDQGFAFHPVGFDLQTPSEQSKRSMGNPIRAVTHALSLLGRLVASQFETLPNTHWIASAPHSKLFARMAAVIHHGGAGTTHTAARCGVPQIIVPHIADQYYWGHRVHALGIGAKPLHRRRLSVQSLEAALTSVGPESTVPRTATQVAQQLAEQAGDSLRQGVSILLAVAAEKEG